MEVPADQTTASVPNLIEGKEMQFRVRAVNKGGPGAPSEATKPMIIKPRHLKPRIDKKNLVQLKVKAGQPIDFDVNVIGEPPPVTTWKLKGKELKSGDRVKIDDKDYNTHLLIKSSKRSDTGIYTLTAKNDSGVDEAQVEVVVLDSPTAPEGPLKVAEVTKDGCKLEWNKPEDDGGTDISHYAVEKMDMANPGKWIPCGEAAGTDFQVEGLTPDHQYKFRVKAVNRQGESEPLVAEKPILAKDPWGTIYEFELYFWLVHFCVQLLPNSSIRNLIFGLFYQIFILFHRLFFIKPYDVGLIFSLFSKFSFYFTVHFLSSITMWV